MSINNLSVQRIPLNLHRIFTNNTEKPSKNHHDNRSVNCIPPNTPLLYSKTGDYRGIHYFLIFALNEAVLTCTHNICFGQKYENSITNSTENCHFYSREKNSCILHGRVFVM